MSWSPYNLGGLTNCLHMGPGAGLLRHWCSFYQLFGLSFWRHPFTAEDQLVSKWSNAKFLKIISNEKINCSTSWMAWGWVHFQKIFILGWIIPLNSFLLFVFSVYHLVIFLSYRNHKSGGLQQIYSRPEGKIYILNHSVNIQHPKWRENDKWKESDMI